MNNKVLNKEEASDFLRKNLGINTQNFYAKKTFKSGKDGKIKISLFPWEMKSDFYCQIVTVNELRDKELTIYVVPYNEDNFARDYDEFPKPDGSGQVDRKYIFDLDELKVVYRHEKEKEDINFKEMTLRDYACIQLGIPESNKIWLNEIIKKKGNGRYSESRTTKLTLGPS